MSLTLYGVSAELTAAFEGLRESPGISGPKYRQQDIDSLAQMILCRNYGKATLELSYLLLAVSLKSPGGTQQAWLNFFWLDEAITPKRFRAAFEVLPVPLQSTLRLSESGLTISLFKKPFTLSPTRISVLASLLEFLVHIDPDILNQDVLFEGVSPNEGVSDQAVKTLASTFQRLLYGYLAEHMQPAQQQRRFRHLWSWLTKRCAGKTVDKHARMEISDEVILEFWQQMVNEDTDSLGFRRYRTVAENFFDLRIAIQCVDAQKNMNHSLGIGVEFDSEVSPDQLQQVLEVHSCDVLDIAPLAKSPKFLTKQQVELCQPIVEAGEIASTFALTIMRMRCFGDWQASVVQALRDKDIRQLEELLRVDAETPQVSTYEQYRETMNTLLMVFLQAQNSGLHVLLHHRVPEALGFLVPRLPGSDQSVLREVLAVDASNQQEGDVAEKLYSAWPELLLQLPNLRKFNEQLLKSFKSNNRQGFKTLPSATGVLPYIDGLQRLEMVSQFCEKHLESVACIIADTDQRKIKFDSDLSIFRNGFISLYGEHS